MQKKMPFLYEKFFDMVRNTSDRGKNTDVPRVNFEIGRKFRLSKAEVQTCLLELEKMRRLELVKPYRHGIAIRD